MDWETAKVLLASAGGMVISVSGIEAALRILLTAVSIIYVVFKIFLLWRRRHDNHDDLDAD